MSSFISTILQEEEEEECLMQNEEKKKKKDICMWEYVKINYRFLEKGRNRVFIQRNSIENEQNTYSHLCFT